jgi:hypothetical protein
MRKRIPASVEAPAGVSFAQPKPHECSTPVSGNRLWNSRRDSMTCHSCRIDCRKFGKRKNRRRYHGTQCRKVFTDARDDTLDGMYLSVEKAEFVLKLLLEGNSV